MLMFGFCCIRTKFHSVFLKCSASLESFARCMHNSSTHSRKLDIQIFYKLASALAPFLCKMFVRVAKRNEQFIEQLK